MKLFTKLFTFVYILLHTEQLKHSMGGGGSKSKNKSEVVNDFVSKSIAENIMNCNNQSSVSQRIDVRGNYNVVKNVNMKQAFSLSSTCFQDSKVMNTMVNDIANSIKQSADAQNIALLGALSSSEAEVENYIYNGVKNEIQSSSIQNIVNSTNADQGIGITGNHNIVEDITMNQVVDMISKNSQSIINETDIANTAKTVVEQSASAKQENPLDAITDMIGAVMDGVMSPFRMVAMIVGLIIVVIAWSIFGGSSEDAAGKMGAISQMMQQQMARHMPQMPQMPPMPRLQMQMPQQMPPMPRPQMPRLQMQMPQMQMPQMQMPQPMQMQPRPQMPQMLTQMQMPQPMQMQPQMQMQPMPQPMPT